MEYQWDQAKAAANLKKHGVAFSDAALALEDPHALTMADPDALDESPRGRAIRIISSRKASRSERRPYEKVR
jgi:uncharacterized DUF497 family protein